MEEQAESPEETKRSDAPHADQNRAEFATGGKIRDESGDFTNDLVECITFFSAHTLVRIFTHLPVVVKSHRCLLKVIDFSFKILKN